MIRGALGILGLVVILGTVAPPPAPFNVRQIVIRNSNDCDNVPSPCVPATCTTTVSSATLSTVQTAVTAAASGATVCVTATGTATWSSPLSITKAIRLHGPGKASLAINGRVDYSPTSGEAVKTFELDGFTFQGGGQTFGTNAPSATVAITGLKVHDNAFNNANGSNNDARAVLLKGLEFGVFYNNTWTNNNIAVWVGYSNDDGWNYPRAYGSASCVYFEDNTFGNGTGSFVVETGQGGRICFRHNTITGYTCGGCEVWDIHGYQGTGIRATVLAEYYHNTVGNATNQRWMNHRGGQAIIANNVISGSGSYFGFTEYQSWNSAYTCHAYPALDQINTSFYSNNTVAGSLSSPSFDNSDATGTCGATHESQYLQSGRDYFVPTSGLEVDRPSTCTTGTYYATTDSDQIFSCASTNHWSLYFTPYAYPHPLRAAGTIIPAATCSRADVVTALTASTYGSTVIIPAGSCTWSTTVTITKGITLQGAGPGVTNITSGVGTSAFVLVYSPDATSMSNDQAFRVSGISWNMNNASGGINVLQNSNTVPMTKLQIVGNAFSNQVGDTTLDIACIRLADLVGTPGTIYGVIAANTFTNCGNPIQSYANEVYSWDNFTLTFGSAQNVYIEDNSFVGNSAFNYGAHGGRYVSRFNNFHLTGSSYQVVWDVHGNQPSGVYATMGCEIYRNRVVLDTGTAVLDDRGGKCLVFQNTITGTAGDWQVREEYDDSISPTTNAQPQHVSDTYYFLNTQNGSSINPTETSDCCAAIAANAQYWLYTASFSGATGVGSGTLAARPSTCTTGVGYWATDQGNWNAGSTDGLFYKCTATNTWTLYYTPYTYPHPLR